MNLNFIRNLPQSAIRGYRWLGLISLLVGLFVWYLATRFSGLPAFILPSPLQVWQRFLFSLSDGELAQNTLVTLMEILLGLFSGSLVAIVLGYLLAKSLTLEKILSPYLVASQAVPAGRHCTSAGHLVWTGHVFQGAHLWLDRFLPRFGEHRCWSAAPCRVPCMISCTPCAPRAGQILLHLEIPAALPIFLGGLRIGATLSVIGAVVGELVGADRGLGVLINVGRGTYDTPMVFVAVFTLVALALSLYEIVSWIEKKLLAWQQPQEH